MLPHNNPTERELSTNAKSTFYYLKYQSFLREKKRHQAILALQNATKYTPDPQLILEQTYYYLRNNNLSRAKKTIRKGLNKYPKNKKLNLAQIRLLFSQDKYKKAVKHLENLTREKNKTHPKFKKLLAELYIDQKKFAKALDILKSIPKDKQTAKTHYLLAKAYSSQNNPKKTIEHLKKSTSKNPSFVRAWAELAYEYEITKDYLAAKKCYQKMLELGKKDTEIFLRLIDIELKLNSPKQALKILDKGPQKQRFFLEATRLFLQHNFFEQSQNILKDLEKKGETSPRAYFYKALIALEKNNNFPQALEYLKHIEKESKFYKKSLILQCKILYKQDKSDKAQKIAQKGTKHFPEIDEFWLLKSDFYAKKEKYTRALQILKRGLEYNPKSTILLFQMGVFEHKLGNIDKSISHMEKVINIDPEHAKALNFLGYTLTERNKDLDRAKILIQKALELEPKNGYFLDSLAWYYYKSQRFEKAWKTISSAVDQVEKDPVIWEHLGDIASKLDKKEKGIEAYKKALGLDTKDPQKIREKLNKLQ